MEGWGGKSNGGVRVDNSGKEMEGGRVRKGRKWGLATFKTSYLPCGLTKISVESILCVGGHQWSAELTIGSLIATV